MSERRAHAAFPVVVAAPSGTGKTTVCRLLVGADPEIVFSISHTTRRMRAGERDGVDYHFVDDAEFRRMIDAGEFLEHAEYNGNRYGTSASAVATALAGDSDVLLEIEVQGARQVRERRADARLIFLLPPSLKTLRDRLESRGTDSVDQIANRLALAERELASIRDFDYAVANDDLDACVARVREILGGERSGETEALRRRFDPAAALERFRAASRAD